MPRARRVRPEPCHRHYARSLTRPHLPQDAETNIIPDNASIYIFANYVWTPDGLHHCKPKFKARDLTAEERAQRSGKVGGGGAEGGGIVIGRVGPPTLGVLALLVVGVGLGVALSRR
mmetsp:Transcript_1444/g.4439  ORF Transcript_1444/g.4439 Transcript_1444/m.4439 type:complete len:117 (-) Transcript_1444:74-424(-)